MSETQELEKTQEEVKSPEEVQKRYNHEFYYRNRERVLQKIECPICCGTYNYYTKSNHLKSQKHQRLQKRLENISTNIN